MMKPSAFYRPPSPPPARVRPLPQRLTREMMRLLSLGELTMLRDAEVQKLEVLKTEAAEAKSAAAAQPPGPAEPAPPVLDSPASRVLLGT